MFWTDLRFWLYAVTLIPFLLCLLFYGLRSPWRFDPVGRALFTLLASITSVLLFATVTLSGVIPVPVTTALRPLLLGGVIVGGWLLLFQILRIQRESRRRADCPRRRSTDR
jgi:hypothetical protein